jgi:hypothetical protein
VSLSPEGKVVAYSARRSPQHRTVEFVERSEGDVREHMEQWQREGWSVLSISANSPSPTGLISEPRNYGAVEMLQDLP